jgi:dynein heavy chain
MEVNLAFSRIEEGYENGLKDYFKKAVGQLNALIEILLTDISPLERQKIETICTIDVHARDVVAKMVQAKVNFIEINPEYYFTFCIFRLKVQMNFYGNVN